MGASVKFDPVAFREGFPQFAEGLFTDAQLTNAFKVATTIIDNSPNALIPYDPGNSVYDREVVLNALVCHLLTMAQRAMDGQAGPVASATEGSVSVSFAVPSVDKDSYFLQTPCGQMFLQLVAKYSVGGIYFDPDDSHHPWS